jgi:hypothetical protein
VTLPWYERMSSTTAWQRALDIHFEDSAWPRWRIDKSLRYTVKSYLHDRRPPSDPVHFARTAQHLQRAKLAARDEEAKSLRLCLAGDWMWRPGQSRRAHAAHQGLSRALETHLADADLRIFNLETPLADAPVPDRAIVRFNEARSLLRAWPVSSVVSIVNNHALDHGVAGLVATRRAIENAGLHCVGGPGWEDAATTLLVNGIRVGVVACTFGVNPWWYRGDARRVEGLPHLPFGAEQARVDWNLAERLVGSLSDCDLRIVVPHWGYEFAYWPSDRLRQDAYRLIQLGADILVGSSPHVLQPVEVVSVDGWDKEAPTQLVRGEKPRAAFIAFSLGNFAGSMPTTACRTGAVLKLEATLSRGQVSLGLLDVQGTWSSAHRFGRAPETVLLSECSPRIQARAQQHLQRVLAISPENR